jgi:hypothetical protein
VPRTAIIKSSWFTLNPAMRWDAIYWIHVSEVLKEAKVDPETATQEQVRAAIVRTEQKISEAQGAG